ncbi:hypothetical protein [Paracoccus alkenifer]|uniref:Transmembrane protein n=1 Tax=Paracoccus alkenifer TaxID=65735 RepID=A0A1H6NI57_9RHOB|nr:hypothetical protein [Paracoccus alkenifer]SEI10278.1 hypothetical protein SAMN04488075_2887 [Paracoccus alkenifer]
MDITIHHMQPILDLIGKYESRGDYDVVYGGIPKAQRPVKLTAMTIAQVIAWQKQVVAAGAASSAAGKYQIIRKTLEASVSALRMNTARLYDRATQDELAMHLLRGRGIKGYLDGAITQDAMVLSLAKEWASLPVPSAMRGASRQILAGQSYYAGDGLNKAHATVAEVRAALAQAKARHDAAATPAPVGPRPSPGQPPAPAKPVAAGAIVAVGIALAIIAIIFFGG